MSEDRETIFAAIRSALDPLPERTSYPDWEAKLSDSRFAPRLAGEDAETMLAARLRAANGVLVREWGALGEFLQTEDARVGYVDAALLAEAQAALGGLELRTTMERERIDEYQFGITRAAGAIAETGSVILKDGDSPYRLGALAPWIHVAVVRRSDVVETVREAVERFGEDPSIIFATGPSKTADVEGILIEGVHGPGCQVCLLV